MKFHSKFTIIKINLNRYYFHERMSRIIRTSDNMRISADGKDQPALRDIAFVTPFAKKSSKSRANPNGTATSEIPGTLCEIHKIIFL